MSKERLEELHKFYMDGIINVDDLVQEIVKLEQLNGVLINQNKRYREALGFYADQKTYETNVVDQWEPVTPINNDKGLKARQALEESE